MKYSTTPFFILGNPRSGTTLFRLMLNSHADIVVPPESGFLQWWHSKYKNIGRKNLSDTIFVSKMIEDILSSKKIEDWKLSADNLVKEIINQKPLNYGELCTIVYQQYGQIKGKKDFIIGDKNNYYINHLDVLDSIYPKTKYIHLIRDGRDVACSYLELNKLETSSAYKPSFAQGINAIAKEWKDNVNKIEFFLKTKNSIKIKYEDLILNTEEILRIVCQFLKVEYRSSMLDYYHDIYFDEPSSTIDWKQKTRQEIDKTNINKYMKKLSSEDLKVFTSITGELLKENGYDID